MNELTQRISEPTPKFWKKIQRIMITLGIVGGAVLTAPISLPAAIMTAGGYLATAGAVGTALSQLTSTKR